MNIIFWVSIGCIVLIVVSVIGLIYFKEAKKLDRFLFAFDAAEYFYEVIYDFCAKSNDELIGNISTEKLDEFIDKTKEKEEVPIVYGEYMIVVKKGVNKSEILDDLQIFLEKTYSFGQKIDKSIVFNTDLYNKIQDIVSKINKVKVLRWEIGDLS